MGRMLRGRLIVPSHVTRSRRLALVLVVLLATSGSARPAADARADGALLPDDGWTLTFADEFDGTALDETRWSTQYPWGRHNDANHELQYYAPDAFEVADGRLRIKGERRSQGGKDYTSGVIASHTSFAQAHGRFEIRARVPEGKGLWPAFWLLPIHGPSPPEIDVFEILGDDPSTAYMTYHFPGKHGENDKTYDIHRGPDFAAAYHEFALVWTPTDISWYVDGQRTFRTEQHLPSGEFYVIANLAIGGDWPGSPDAATPFPAHFDIDYIRVYAATDHERIGRTVETWPHTTSWLLPEVRR